MRPMVANKHLSTTVAMAIDRVGGKFISEN